jgi:hypothetical protein
MKNTQVMTMEISKRTRLRTVEFDNEVGKPTRIIFRTTTFINGMDVEVEDVAKIILIGRDIENDIIPNSTITYKQAFGALWGIYNSIKEPVLAEPPAQNSQDISNLSTV